MIPVFLFHQAAGRRRLQLPGQRSKSNSPVPLLLLCCVVAIVSVSVWLGVYVSIWQVTTLWEYQHVDRRRIMSSSSLHSSSMVQPSFWRKQGEDLVTANPSTITDSVVNVALDSPAWTNKYNLVHVVNTRFMQHQAHLLNLGRARMELFQSITLPSMAYQTTRQFIWMIRIDPDLPDELKTIFLNVMDSLENLVVVLSNQNVDDFRKHARDDIVSEHSLLGRTSNDRQRRFDLVKAYFEAAQSRVVLESRLDADDALSLDLIDWIQREAYMHLSKSSPECDFRVWCLGTHMEWQFYNPLDTNSTIGSLVAFPYGHCVTPGITFGFQIKATSDDIPTHKHHKLHKSIPKCRQGQQSNCLAILKKQNGNPLALRARTPTSAGMMNVFMSSQKDESAMKQFELWNRLQKRAWNAVQRLFGIDEASVYRMRQKLDEDLYMIAADNALGQCTPGHSCKLSSQKILESLQRKEKHPEEAK